MGTGFDSGRPKRRGSDEIPAGHVALSPVEGIDAPPSHVRRAAHVLFGPTTLA